MMKQLGNINLIDLFHQNTILTRFNTIKITHNIKKLYCNKHFIKKSNEIPHTYLDDSTRIQLNNIDNNDEIYKLLSDRRTKREFYISEPLNFIIFSNIIKYSLGISNITNTDDISMVKFTYPTAGGFNTLMFYILINNVENIEAGLYLYNPYDNTLILKNKNITVVDLQKITSAYNLIQNSFFTIYIVANLEYSIQKYGDRSYRFSNLEAGHVGQNIYLTCEKNKLSTVASGSFYDLDFFNTFNLDKKNKYLLYEITVGNSYE